MSNPNTDKLPSPVQDGKPPRREVTGDGKPFWQVTVAIIGAVGVIVAAVIGGRASAGSGGPSQVSPAKSAPAPPATPSGQAGASGSTSLTGGWSFPGAATGEVDVTAKHKDISINDLINTTTGGTADLSFTGDREPGVILPQNGAEIVDMGEIIPSVQKCKSALTAPPASVIANALEYYCVQTGDGTIYLMQEWQGWVDNNNAVDTYDLTFWQPT